jgi:hypothetical protein
MYFCKVNFTKDIMTQTKKLALWNFIWVLSMAIATFGPEYLWNNKSILTVIGVTLNLVLGVKWVLITKNYIQSLDELQKKIQLESLALSLGLSVIFGLSFSLLDQKNLIPIDAEIGFLVGFMGITYLGAIFFNNRKYQ